MQLIGIFLSACVILAIAQATARALMLLFFIALIWGACLHPKELMVLLTYCAALSLLTAHPWASLTVVGIAVAAAQFIKSGSRDP